MCESLLQRNCCKYNIAGKERETIMGKRIGDRRDGVLLRKLDSMHYIMPMLYPNRCDNEAYISECIDLTNVERYLEQKNLEDPDYRYNLFQVVVTTVLKILTLRPKMNRFIANKNMYQRNEITAAFVVKKIFADDGEEGLAILRGKEDDTIDTIHQKIYQKVSSCRGEQKDGSTAFMDKVQKLPRFLCKILACGARFLDRHGWMPRGAISSDPYYASAVLSNLGSIKLKSGYHHLTNWGTNSLFVAIGERKMRPFYDENGNVEMRLSVDIGLTIDERLADGYYYSKTVRLMRTLLENPELLERPLKEEVDF